MSTVTPDRTLVPDTRPAGAPEPTLPKNAPPVPQEEVFTPDHSPNNE